MGALGEPETSTPVGSLLLANNAQHMKANNMFHSQDIITVFNYTVTKPPSLHILFSYTHVLMFELESIH